MTCVAKAFSLMTSGADVLDSIIAGVNIRELDREEMSVGYGGVQSLDTEALLNENLVNE